MVIYTLLLEAIEMIGTRICCVGMDQSRRIPKYIVAVCRGIKRNLAEIASIVLAVASANFAVSAIAQTTLTPPKVITSSPTGVNMLDGTFFTSVTDLSLGSLSLDRSYLGGRETSNHYFGPNWTHNFDIYVRYRTASLNHEATTTVVIGREKYVYYGMPESAVPQAEDADTSFKVVNGNYVFTDRLGVIYTIYIPGGNVTIQYPNGRVVNVIKVNGLPKIVTDSYGAAIVFEYTGTSVSVACIFNMSQNYVSTSSSCASALLKINYQYTDSKLTTVTDMLGNQSHYSYNSWGLTCLTDPGSSTCKITNYYRAGRFDIERQVLGDGSTWYFYCSCSGSGGRDDQDSSFPDDTASWTDPSGKSMAFDYHDYLMTAYYDENNRQHPTTYSGRYLTSITSPEGNKTWFLSRDERFPSYRFVAKPSSGLPDITQGAQTMPPPPCSNPITCHLPLTIADANGNVTQYAYDQTHGGPLFEMRPAPTPGAARPLKLYAYALKYAYIKNSAGALIPAASPIWLIQSETQCQTVAGSDSPTCDAGAQQTVTTYEYGADGTPDNLLVRGKVVTADGVSLRTCMSYDSYRRKISETRARAGLTVCS